MIIADTTKGVPLELVEVVLPDGTRVMVQKALAPTTKSTWDVPFNPVTVDLICQRIVEGEGLSDICNGLDGFPEYATWCRWRREHTWVDESVTRARTDRAEKHRDKVMKLADGAMSTKDPINATNARIDAHKWAAAIDNPSIYSPRSKMEATINAPTQIIVQTGIDRTPVDVNSPKETLDVSKNS